MFVDCIIRKKYSSEGFRKYMETKNFWRFRRGKVFLSSRLWRGQSPQEISQFVRITKPSLSLYSMCCVVGEDYCSVCQYSVAGYDIRNCKHNLDSVIRGRQKAQFVSIEVKHVERSTYWVPFSAVLNWPFNLLNFLPHPKISQSNGHNLAMSDIPSRW